MALTIKDLSPREVWKHFEALTQIPRPSGHMEKIQKFLLDFGKSINVNTWQDEAGNIIMRKPATPAWRGARVLSCRRIWIWCPKRLPTASTTF